MFKVGFQSNSKYNLTVLLTEGYWEAEENRKTYLSDFARTKGFNPLAPEGWYALTKEDLDAEKVRIEVRK